MARNSLGRQRVWSRNDGRADEPYPFLWYAQGEGSIVFGTAAAAQRRLDLLERVWAGSRNYSAVFDALAVVGHRGDIVCPAWLLRAAREAIKKPEDVARWKRQHLRDILDSIRLSTFSNFRYGEEGKELVSRDEAARYTADLLSGTRAATTKDVVLKLVSKMKRNDARAWGRYYLGAGTLVLESKIIHENGTTPKHLKVYREWRRRAAQRGDTMAQKIEAAEAQYRKSEAVKTGQARA